MNPSKRQFMKILPFAALAGVAVKLGDVETLAYEFKPEKKYLFVLPECTPQQSGTDCG